MVLCAVICRDWMAFRKREGERDVKAERHEKREEGDDEREEGEMGKEEEKGQRREGTERKERELMRAIAKL